MKKIEFLIVGNGLAGTLLAFEMLENGLDFRILSSPNKNRASEVAAGMFNPLVFKRLTKSWLADELLPVMKSRYKNLESLLDQKFYYEKDIVKPLSAQEKILWQERKTNPGFSKYIHDVTDKKPVDNLRPASGFGVVTGSGYLNLSPFLNAADKYLKTKALLLQSTFNFRQINPKAKKFTFEKVEAEKIVFCEGAHLAQNPFFNFVKLVPVKGEVLLVLSANLADNYILNKKVFLLPVGNQVFKAGSTYDWKDLTETPTQRGKDSITERLDELISAEYSIQEHWAGIRPTVSDRRPVLGIHPEFKNLYIFNGLGTKGVMLAPYFAKEMLKLLTMNGHHLQGAINLMRFWK
jgi:hypothetical protein